MFLSMSHCFLTLQFYGVPCANQNARGKLSLFPTGERPLLEELAEHRAKLELQQEEMQKLEASLAASQVHQLPWFANRARAAIATTSTDGCPTSRFVRCDALTLVSSVR